MLITIYFLTPDQNISVGKVLLLLIFCCCCPSGFVQITTAPRFLFLAILNFLPQKLGPRDHFVTSWNF